MNKRVLFHVGFLMESLPTVLAWIGPRVRVDQEVGRERRRPFETFAAYLAVEASFLLRNTDK